MTAGHRHRVIRLRRDGLTLRLLTGPTLHRTRDRIAAHQSRLVYGETDDPAVYRLSPLGFLHGLIGLTVAVDE